ncbi:hypothetical protein BGX24_005475 [Mortierella sp. AD032]|nr:hypothetical protein BGX24_005475 [Mortierella sp. AD032]
MTHPSLLGIIILPLFFFLTAPTFTWANTEKAIFTVNHSAHIPSENIKTDTSRQYHGIIDPPSCQLISEQAYGVDLKNRQFLWYVLKDLDNKASFELRISYPATSPADFDLSVWTLTEAQEQLPTSVDLLDHFSENTMFARIKATYTGVSYVSDGNAPSPETLPVPFNLVLERLYLLIPYQALKLAAVIAVVAVIGLGSYKKFAMTDINTVRTEHFFDIVEILHLLGQFLSPPDLFACCQQGKALGQDEVWAKTIFAKYGEHIRNLTLGWRILIDSANQAPCSNLRSLHITNISSKLTLREKVFQNHIIRRTQTSRDQTYDQWGPADTGPFLSPEFEGVLQPSDKTYRPQDLQERDWIMM